MRKLLIAAGLVAIAGALWAGVVKGRGQSNARILLEVYSDYQCPYCKTLYENTLRPLVAEYVDTGKVYLIHHEFPLPRHAYAMQAACYACAANRVGKYDQVGDALFREQQSWSATGKVEETVASVLTREEAKKVRILARDPAIVAEVREDIQAGLTAHVDGTPTVILTCRQKQYRIPATTSYPVLRRFIDQLLSGS
jgi:protein-disulfide isomerase